MSCSRLSSDIASGAGPAATSGLGGTSSTSVFHAPHPEHCPVHFGWPVPQSVQACTVFILSWRDHDEGCHSGRDPAVPPWRPAWDGSAGQDGQPSVASTSLAMAIAALAAGMPA